MRKFNLTNHCIKRYRERIKSSATEKDILKDISSGRIPNDKVKKVIRRAYRLKNNCPPLNKTFNGELLLHTTGRDSVFLCDCIDVGVYTVITVLSIKEMEKT